MDSKERMLTGFWNEQPDMVPVAPDTSNYIPCRLTGKPYWDIYLHNDPTLWEAYLEVVKRFKFDGWFTYGYLGLQRSGGELITPDNDCREFRHEIVTRSANRIVQRNYMKTPAGEICQETVYYRNDPPTVTEGYFHDITEMARHFDYLWPDPPTGTAEFNRMKQAVGGLGVVSIGVGYPTLFGIDTKQRYSQAMLDYYDHHDLVMEYAERESAYWVRYCELALEAKPDFIMTGASGTLTLQSPEIFREIGLPTLKKVTRMAKHAGIPTCLHSCGLEKELVKICAEETDLSTINPLEEPPMGDCDLGELKERYGAKIALMGNINTISVMQRGTSADVEQAARQCIDDAAGGGGFVLSTGDQCPVDTPDENICKLVEVARTYGKY